jgi:hypothetical protein
MAPRDQRLRKAAMSHTPRLSAKYEHEMESNFENQDEAFRLLELINAEFQSDPQSVQCFDLRIVERVKWCVARRREFVKNNPIYADPTK